MEKMNCWEMKKCGREVGGREVASLGICPAALARDAHEMNHGINGGRICWAIAGTLCRGEVQGTFAQKKTSCLACEVYRIIRREEAPQDFKVLMPGQVI